MEVPAPQGITVRDAAGRFTALMNPKPPETVKAEIEAPPVESEVSVAEATVADEPATETPIAQEKPTRKVKVDGEELEVDEDELVRGYSRTSDYTRKTQKLAEERKALESEAAAVREERKQYAETLIALKAQLSNVKEPDVALLDSDPLEFVRQKATYDAYKERLSAIESEQKRLAEAQQADNQKSFRSYVEGQQQKLYEAIPEWKDAKKMASERDAIAQTGRSLGFSDDELSQLYDHRAVVALRKAMLYDKMVVEARKKVEAVKDGPKTAKPGQMATHVVNKDLAAAKERFSKANSVRNAGAVLNLLLNKPKGT